MKKISKSFPIHVNLKWKLTLWAGFLMLFLFLGYSLSQYVVLQNWAKSQETETIQKKMKEVTAYLEEMSAEKDISDSVSYLEVLNEEDQTIRIINENNSPVVTVSDDEDIEEWVKPKHVTSKELVRLKQEDESLLIYRTPITTNSFSGTVEITRDIENYESLFEQIGLLVLVTGIVAIILSFIGGRFISFQLLKPINSLIGTMRKVKENGLKERVPLNKKRDEMTELGIMFNELMDNLEEAFEQQQQFIEDASHELRTPLTIINGHLSLIKRWGKNNPDVLERSIQLSLNETDRLTQLVYELLALSKGEEFSLDANNMENNPVKQQLEGLIENYQLVHSEFEFISNLEIDSGLTVNMIRNHFEQIMVIILDNAINYSEDKKTIKISARENSEKLIIEVTDFGIGIPEKDIPFIFRRFYRVDKSRNRKHGGNGLGLSIVKRLVDMYKGTIEIDSVSGEKTTVRITFPR